MIDGEVVEVARHETGDKEPSKAARADLSPLLAGLVPPGREGAHYEVRVRFDDVATPELVIGGRGEAKVATEQITLARRLWRCSRRRFGCRCNRFETKWIDVRSSSKVLAADRHSLTYRADRLRNRKNETRIDTTGRNRGDRIARRVVPTPRHATCARAIVAQSVHAFGWALGYEAVR